MGGQLYRIPETVAPAIVSQGRKISSHTRKLFLFTIASEGEHKITETSTPFAQGVSAHQTQEEDRAIVSHLSEDLYEARPRIQGSHLKTNHPHNNYNPLGIPKKSSLFTSTNVAPGDRLNTQFEI